jgi:hypothetical protein
MTKFIIFLETYKQIPSNILAYSLHLLNYLLLAREMRKKMNR